MNPKKSTRQKVAEQIFYRPLPITATSARASFANGQPWQSKVACPLIVDYLANKACFGVEDTSFRKAIVAGQRPWERRNANSRVAVAGVASRLLARRL